RSWRCSSPCARSTRSAGEADHHEATRKPGTLPGPRRHRGRLPVAGLPPLVDQGVAGSARRRRPGSPVRSLRELREHRAPGAGRATRYGLNAAILVVLILGVIALVEAVSYRHSYRVDLTENKRWSLSPQTMKVVGDLSVPVKAIAFFRPDQPGKRTAEDLLKQ